MASCLPSGNQTWQWKMDHRNRMKQKSVTFLIKLPFSSDFPASYVWWNQRVFNSWFSICFHPQQVWSLTDQTCPGGTIFHCHSSHLWRRKLWEETLRGTLRTKGWLLQHRGGFGPNLRWKNTKHGLGNSVRSKLLGSEISLSSYLVFSLVWPNMIEQISIMI